MLQRDIKKIIEEDKFLVVENNKGELFLYYDKYQMLIPTKIEYKVTNKEIPPIPEDINGISYLGVLIKANQAKEIFDKLAMIQSKIWKTEGYLWLIDNSNYYLTNYNRFGIVYNNNTKKIENIGKRKAQILQVFYLSGLKIYDKNSNKIYLGILLYHNLKPSDTQIVYEKIKVEEQLDIEVPNKASKYEEQVDTEIQNLLDCDKRRCGLASYEKEILYDIKAGHWDVFENPMNKKYADFIARNPILDVKKNGVIGIDFGTKSTVVVKQEGTNEIRPIRIGSLSLKAEVAESDYENPTIISCMSIETFLKSYFAKSGRPETSCEDLFVSYNAYNDYKNCPPENFMLIIQN